MVKVKKIPIECVSRCFEHCMATCPLMGNHYSGTRLVIFSGSYDRSTQTAKMYFVKNCVARKGLGFYKSDGRYYNSFVKALFPGDYEILKIKWDEVFKNEVFCKNYRLRVSGGGYLPFSERISVCRSCHDVVNFVGCVFREHDSNFETQNSHFDFLKNSNNAQNEKYASCSENTVSARLAACEHSREELMSQLKREHESSSMKGLLISMISHEIRAPLTVIQGAADLIAKCYGKISNDELESYICTIVKSVSRAAKTIDKILVLSQVQNDQLIFRPNDGDVVDLCREIMSDMIDLNGERKIAIKLSRNFPKVLSFDPVLLRHVISNLLSNAIKYSPKDSLIEIFLSYNGSALEIKIRDHGVGIPNDEMKNVFKLFSRGSNVSKIGGLGIGMFIVKRCVLLQGGKLDVKSKEGEGTTFRVTLPITKNDFDEK